MTGAPETNQSLDPAERLGIERDQRRERTVRRAAGKEEKLCRGPTTPDGMKSLRTLARCIELNGRRRGFGCQETRRWRQRHNRGIGKR